MKLVGISGAQGAGKSSMLVELTSRGWAVDSFKVSRAVQLSLGWDNLDRVMDSPLTMMEFQEEVYRQKYQNDAALLKTDGDITLTERTFADICAYTNLWSWKFVDQGRLPLGEAIAFLSEFTHKCSLAHNEIYAGTVLLPLMPHVQWEDDPKRASRTDVERVYEDISRFVDRKTHITHPRFRISAASIGERADQVEAFLKTL